MKRNGMAVPPLPRSFEELKRERSAASNPGAASAAGGATQSPTSDVGGGGGAGSPRPYEDNDADHLHPTPRATHSSQLAPHTTGDTEGPGAAANDAQRSGQPPERHRYDAEEDTVVAAPRSLNAHAEGSPALHPATTTPRDLPPREGGRRTSNSHGIDLSKSPATAALAAGARVAGASQPFFFSLKLPPASITHVGPAAVRTPHHHAATASADNNNSAAITCDSPYGAGTDRRERMSGNYARTASASSPHKTEDVLAGTTPRIPAAPTNTVLGGDHRATAAALDVDTQQSPTLFPRDVGPLPASQARARNRLPSGTHIRRRPRSVANRRATGGANPALTGAMMMDSVENVLLMPGTVESGSPLMATIDAPSTPSNTATGPLAGGRSAFANPALRPRGSGGAVSGRGTGGGRGTGRARDVLPPNSSSTRPTAGVPHRRRADPSPAPSRPPRARKAAAVIRANATPVTPALGMSSAPPVPTISPSSPMQLDLAQSHTSSHQNDPVAVAAVASAGATSPSQPIPMWSIPNSPGGASPLNGSLDTRFLLSGDKDAAVAAAVAAVGTSGHHNLSATTGSTNPPLSNSFSTGNNTRSGLASTVKPPSGRVLNSAGAGLAHTHTPRASTTSVRGVEEGTPKRHDYAKLAEHYIQMCGELGELPNLEWVSGLKGGDAEASHPRTTGHSAAADLATTDHLSYSDFATTTGSSDVKDSNNNNNRTGSPRDSSQATSGAFSPNATTSSAQPSQQTLTPRGGGGAARQRGVGVAAAATPRARTPVASRAKSPRGGAPTTTSASSPAGPAKRSGSVGRITTVNRASILGSSQAYGSGSGAVHTPRARGTTTAASTHNASMGATAGASMTPRESVADLYAQRVSRYCADHLQPYVDNMKSIQQQRRSLEEMLNAFVSVATTVIPPSATSSGGGGFGGAPTATAAATEASRKSLTPLPVNPNTSAAGPTTTTTNSGAHSHRGGGPHTTPSPVPSSLSTTPRKPSTSRTSVTASLPNTTAAAAAAIMSRRTASAASAKAACLTDGLQNVQGAVVALLSSLAEGTKLAQLPVTNLTSPTHDDELASMNSQSLSKLSGFPLSPSAFASVGQAGALSQQQQQQLMSGATSTGNVPPEDRSQTLAQLTSPISTSMTNVSASRAPSAAPPGPTVALAAGTTAVPHLPLASAIHAARAGDVGVPQSPLTITDKSGKDSSGNLESGRHAGGGANALNVVCPPPIKYLDFVEAQEREIAAQLSAVCESVRTALGAPATSTDAALADGKPLTTAEESHGAFSASTGGVATGPAVQLEQADMLNNPFFVPSKYLQNLSAHLSTLPDNAHNDDDGGAEVSTPKMGGLSGDGNSVRASLTGTMKSAAGTPKSGKSAAAKKSKGAKVSSSSSAGVAAAAATTSAGLASSVSGIDAGGLTGRSSTDSTPRYHRPSISAFAPLFTVRLSTDDTSNTTAAAAATAAGGHAADATTTTSATVDSHRRSVSSSSTENAYMSTADASISGMAETFVLHCIQPPTAGLTPRQSIDSGDLVNSKQISATDLGSSMASSQLNATTSSAKGGASSAKAGKRATSAGAGKRGAGGGQRSKSSGVSNRAGTAGVSGGSLASTTPAEAPRTTLVAPWLNNSQGGRGGSSAAGSSASSSKKTRKKSSTAGLSSSSAGTATTTTTAAASTTANTPTHTHHARSHSHQVLSALQAEQQQRQLAEAWRLWSALEIRFVSSRVPAPRTRPSSPDVAKAASAAANTNASGVAFGEQEEETQQFSPRPSSSSVKPATSATATTTTTEAQKRLGTAVEAVKDDGDDETKRAEAQQSPKARESTTDNSNNDAAAALASPSLSPSPAHVAEEGISVHGSVSTPPTAKAPTAAASPAHAVAVTVPSVETVSSGENKEGEESPVGKALASWNAVAAAPSGSRMGSPNKELEGTVVPSKTAVFTEQPSQPPSAVKGGKHQAAGKKGDLELDDEEEEGEDEDDDHAGFSATTARVAENMAHLSAALDVPRRLNMEDSALHMRSDLPTAPASKQSSQATAAPHTLSVTLPQHAALASASPLSSDEVLTHSGAPSARVSETQQKAARRIAEWWQRVQSRRQRAAQMRAAHASENEQQRQKVLAARLRNFLLRVVCRRRLQHRIRARELEAADGARKAHAAGPADLSDSLELHSTDNNSNSNVTPRSAAAAASSKKSSKATGSAATSTSPPLSASSPTASTSREKFLRAKEQRKAMGTAAPSGTAGKEAAYSSPPRVPPLPLASSGISTFAMNVYESDSSFTVSAIHRLLHAPPSLLYATCTAALHYPTHPPMAYVDNTSRAKSVGGGGMGEEDRQQSEAPPEPDARVGGNVHGEEFVSRSLGRRSAGRVGGSVDRDSGDIRKTSWRTKGICYVRFPQLRGYFSSAYEARIPPRTVPAAMDSAAHLGAAVAASSMSPLDSTLNSLTTSYRGGSRQQASATVLLVPATMRYDSVVDANELQHPKPVIKSFHRPFEQWGMAYNLTSRIFCAAAIYAWQLIFSHTPFDDAKQRELPTREDRQARLERVAERNDIILDCYGVRNEREWMREATKDLSFVGQIYMPSYPGDDPAQEKECRDNYEFVKNFLYQCFPNVNKLSDIPDFLVGAGIYFVLKEVFHISKDSPSTRRLQKYVPRMLVKNTEDYLRAVTPTASPLYAGADDVGSDDEDDRMDPSMMGGSGAHAMNSNRFVSAPTSLVTPRATDYGKGGNGLSGLQRNALHRYEQLRQLYHLSYGMMDEEERAACAWGGVPLAEKHAQQQQQQKPRSPGSVAKSAKDKSKTASQSSCGEEKAVMAGTNSSVNTAASEDTSATSPMRRYMVHGGAGPMTPLRATPTTTALSSAFNTPAAMREGPRQQQQQQQNQAGPGSRRSSNTPAPTASPSAPKRTLPPRETDIQLAHIPHRLLRPSAADAQFVRDFEVEVNKSVYRIIESVAGRSNDLSFNSTELPAALAAEADVHDALDIAYPEHFLVKLSEMLAFELFGLQVSLSSCEDLESTSS